MKLMTASRSSTGFTLIELSIVVLVLALLATAALRYANSQSEAKAIAATNATLDVVDAAIYNYQNNNTRLPCPADITQAENTAAFGTEVDSLADGLCTGYNFINSGTDPDGPGGSNPYAPDPLDDPATENQVVEGSIPTKALHIADKYAYDGWGNKIFYAVDKRMTASGAYTTYLVGNVTIGAIVVRKDWQDPLSLALTYKGIYALFSAGKNGHGAYARNMTGSASRINAGSSNMNELVNCHCTTTGVSSGNVITRIFIQNTKNNDYSNYSDNFDDIVRFKIRGNVLYNGDLQ